MRLFWLLLCLQFLNLSIDAPDATRVALPEQLCVNDVESLVEFVLEEVCNYQNIIPEYDDNDSDSDYKKIECEYDIFCQNIFSLSFQETESKLSNRLHKSPYRQLNTTFSIEALKPPPKC